MPASSKNDKREIFILAGGLSTRMGRSKSQLRLGSRSMLGHVRAAARETGWPVRIVRRDAVKRCGPLGGIYTALKRSRAEVVLFLACDMPFVSMELLEWMVRDFRKSDVGLFASNGGKAGFPFLLRREGAMEVILEQIRIGEFSLQALAKKLQAKLWRLPRGFAGQLINVNTPEELEKARRLL